MVHLLPLGASAVTQLWLAQTEPRVLHCREGGFQLLPGSAFSQRACPSLWHGDTAWRSRRTLPCCHKGVAASGTLKHLIQALPNRFFLSQIGIEPCPPSRVSDQPVSKFCGCWGWSLGRAFAPGAGSAGGEVEKVAELLPDPDLR